MVNIIDATGQKINTPMGQLTIGPFLGRGKTGYFHLLEHQHKKYVLKLFQHEPSPFYQSGDQNKVDIEMDALTRLKNTNIPIPELIIANQRENYLIKELIDGPTATELIIKNQFTDHHIKQLFEIFYRAKSHGINLDYFPDNFVVQEDQLYYIDYEFNPYDPQWDLINWGLFYYANHKGLKQYQKDHNPLHINQEVDSGMPIKEPFWPVINYWVDLFSESL